MLNQIPLVIAAAQLSHASLFSTLATVPGTSNLENIAIRQSTGDILVTSTTSNILNQISPNGAYSPIPVANISSNTALLGITELDPDIFYFIGSNLSGTTAEPESNRVWKIDLRSPERKVELVAKFDDPEMQVLNGMTKLNENEVLISDSGAGNIVHLNVRTGNHSIVLADPIFKPTESGIGVGINGIHTHDEYLYFTSLDQEIFGRIPISISNPSEPIEILAEGLVHQDDFALTRDVKKALISNNGDFTLTEVDIESRGWKVFVNERALQDASSVALRRCDRDGTVEVYVTGSKNLSGNGNETIGRLSRGQVRL